MTSISAMPVYIRKSHEELRWEDYQLQNKGGAAINTSNTLNPSLTSVNHTSSLFPSNPFCQRFGSIDRNREELVESSSLRSNPFARQPSFGELHKVKSSNVFSSSLPYIPCCCGSFSFGGLHGSNFKPYALTPEVGGVHQDEKPLSISAYKDKSHEELRLEHYQLQGIGAAGIGASKTFGSSLASASCSSSLFPSNPFTRQNDLVERHGGEPVNVFSTSFPSYPFAQQSGFGNLHKGESANMFSSSFSPNPFSGQPGFGSLHKGESFNVSSPLFPSNPFARQTEISDLYKGESVNVSSSPFTSTPLSQCSYRPSTLGGWHFPPDNAIPKKNSDVTTPKDEGKDVSVQLQKINFMNNLKSYTATPLDEKPLSISAYRDKSHEELRLEHYQLQGIGASGIGTSKTVSPSLTSANSSSSLFPSNPFNVFSPLFPSNPFVGQNYNSTQKDSDVTTPKEEGSDISVLLPNLGKSGYYTEPGIKELEAKEKDNPGFCSQVKDFLVGKHGYGSIKFWGETDVRNLDIETYVRFNEREVIVYADVSKKPKIGGGPAEVSLLNLKCIDPKTGKQYVHGPKVDKYRELLKKKASEEGAEFVSYDPVRGEWKFRKYHF